MNLTEIRAKFKLNYVIPIILIVIIISIIFSLFFQNNNEKTIKVPKGVPIANIKLFKLSAIDYNSFNFDVHYVPNVPKNPSKGGKIYVDIKNINFYQNSLLKSQESEYLSLAQNYLRKYGINPKGKNIIYVYN
jgi:hypothetical protein